MFGVASAQEDRPAPGSVALDRLLGLAERLRDRSARAARRLRGGDLAARLLQLLLAPRLADQRPELRLFLGHVLLHGGLEAAELDQPLVARGVELAETIHQARSLARFGLMLLVELVEARIGVADVAHDRVVDESLLDLLVELELGVELRPLPASIGRACGLDLLERGTGLLVHLLELVESIHGNLRAWVWSRPGVGWAHVTLTP